MSNTASQETLDAMRDEDRHATGTPHTDKNSAPHGEAKEHTKPAGDQRNVIDKEETQTAYRGDRNRGN